MAEPVLEPGEQFRKAKRALLAIAAVAILYGLASIGPDFEPQVLGHGVKIQSWIISLGLLVYTAYLYIGFEHEQRRASAAYRELIYSGVAEDTDPEAAIIRLLQPVHEFAAKVSLLSEELMMVERTYRQFAPDYNPRPEDVTSPSYAQMKINEAIARSAEIVVSKERTPQGYLGVLEQLKVDLDRLPELVKADVLGLLKPGIEANLSHKSQADQAIGRLEQVQEQMTAAGAILKVAHTDIAKLSRSLSDRERYMFTFYDTWAPRLLTAGAVVALVANLAQNFPEVPQFVQLFNLGFFLFQCWRMF
jgi:hypothetical protein